MNDPRFSIIPGWIVTDPRLKGRDLQVLCLLGRHIDKAGWCFRSQVKMAKQLACARSTVQSSLDRLMKIGVVERRAGDSRDGRDVSYHYRVVFDRSVAAATFGEWEQIDGDDDDETGCRYTGTPADIPAPPAAPGSAPPAGSGSAPYKNDPNITPPAEPEREVRASEREDGQSDGQANRKSVERAFERAFQAWPTSIGDSRPEALKAWIDLTAEEREGAFAEAGRYAEAARATGRKHLCSHAVYLREKRWLALPPRVEAERPAFVLARPYGKLWGVARLKTLLAGPTGPVHALTKIEETLVSQGRYSAEELLAEKRVKSGFPAINAMHEKAANRQGVTVSTKLEPLAAMLEPVPVDSERFEEWKLEHARRGWPWFADIGDQRVVFFPAGGPGGLNEFEAAIRANEAEGNDDGARQAAE
ncbi:helix-turn-helix domain-containing protein [Nitratireductor indicus]|uniref:helix-turn-helix domain-containing protein n=1 Tax=Nitratireductor indicus TaxID=721133 RepID=UPI00287479D6|nr:helix-turn-helix domain-containing protein [Nitratireductor indicus]MDS1135583.1 helix-turn-helix domain-containing protein [Nitratireductor indicus]